MATFNVEVITEPVVNGDWSALRHVTDLIPGAMLVEDPVEPQLILPVDADTQGRAFLFVDGVLQLAGVVPLKGSIDLDESPDDIDFDYDENASTDLNPICHVHSGVSAEVSASVKSIRDWVERVPASPVHC